ncbi:hypothetical protein C7212DRAFT_301266 [Tuber magnatum]|uniref:AMP-dependent synthetase/ligase domain-containing protein n=1 Tax=Tuber magnatum TaxID=42249 RepID=A0A317SH99_9PEZI|nr:hypothetical protein C7212DRAFT_301266 [Tuber magnatum]
MFEDLELNVVTYTLISLVLGLMILPVIFQKDPDIHPMILNRQSNVSRVRNPKESAVHRSTLSPPGYPLVSGLGLPTDQKYRTRDGDIRDVWNQAVKEGKGKVLSVKGSEVKEFDIDQLTQNIHSLGSYIKSIPGAKRIAIYLSNDIENLVASFACAFYDLTLIVLPFDPESSPDVTSLLNRSRADVLIAPAGDLALNDVDGAKNIKEIIHVVEPGSQHLDWTSSNGNVKSSVYHNVIKVAGTGAGSVDLDGPAVIAFGRKHVGEERRIEMAEFNHKQIIAGVASTIASIRPSPETLKREDIFVPVDTLSDLYTRIFTYAALASGATVALNPIAGIHADLELCVKRVRPTVIVASTPTLASTAAITAGSRMEIWHNILHYFQCRTLESGRIPKGNALIRLNDYTRPNVGEPSRLRLVFGAETAGDLDSQPLNSEDLNDLRAYLGARVVYGLKHHMVAGPINQQHVYDYRVQPQVPKPSKRKDIPRKCAHFGGVAPGCEVFTRDWESFRASDAGGSRGEIVVRGPTVIGGEVPLGVVGKWWPDGVLSYV